MTKEELLAALRAAPGPSRELDAEIAFATGYFDRLKLHDECRIEMGNRWDDIVNVHVIDKGELIYGESYPPLTSSLDAAAAFRERMLLGWGMTIVWDALEKGVSLYTPYDPVGEQGCFDVSEHCATECLSMCAAVVAALIAQEGKNV